MDVYSYRNLPYLGVAFTIISSWCQSKCIIGITDDLIAKDCVIASCIIKLQDKIWCKIGYLYWLW